MAGAAGASCPAAALHSSVAAPRERARNLFYVAPASPFFRNLLPRDDKTRACNVAGVHPEKEREPNGCRTRDKGVITKERHAGNRDKPQREKELASSRSPDHQSVFAHSSAHASPPSLSIALSTARTASLAYTVMSSLSDYVPRWIYEDRSAWVARRRAAIEHEAARQTALEENGRSVPQCQKRKLEAARDELAVIVGALAKSKTD